VQAGRFRQDLFYRLNVIQISLPALRERLDDLPQLGQRILARIAQESHLPEVPRLSDAALSALLHHRFPGNVRELENLLHRAVALSAHAVLEPEDLGLPHASLDSPFLDAVDLLLPSAMSDVTAAPARANERTNERPSSAVPPTGAAAAASAPAQAPTLPTDLAAHLDQVERDILVLALEKHRLNRTAAGASMGLSLRQMRYRMARLGVQVTDQGIVLGERFDPDADADTA